MQHRYLLRAASQREEWDAFVSTHPWGHFLQSWGWGELKAGAGWHPLRLALWDMEQQEIVAAAQVLRRSPAHIPPRLGHLAYIPRGPVLNWHAGDHFVAGYGRGLAPALLRVSANKQGRAAAHPPRQSGWLFSIFASQCANDKGWHNHCTAGSRNVTAVPSSGALLILIVPPWALTRPWAIERPNPLPACEEERVLDASTR